MCFVEVLVLSFCWLLVEVLVIFCWFWLQGSAWYFLVVGCCERRWLLLFYALLDFLEGCWIFLSILFSFWLSVLGSCSHLLSIFNGDCCVICSLILV